MNRKVSIACLLLGMTVTAQAQSLIFCNETEQNVGEVMWKKPVTVSFTITNKGSDPLIINDVNASCGCLDTKWDRNPVAPKASTAISVTYDAKLLGHFEKFIEVFTNASAKPVYLTVKGVVRSEISDYSKEYPVQIGPFYLNKKTLDFPDVSRGEHPTLELEILNTATEACEPVLMHLPSYIEAKSIPEKLQPKVPGKLQLTLLSDKLTDLGLKRTSVYLSRFSGDKVSDDNEILITSVLLPDFSQLTGYQRNAVPSAALSQTELNLQLSKKQKGTSKVTLTNNGKSDLEIYSLQVSNPAINVHLGKRKVRPGAKIQLRVKIQEAYLRKQTGVYKVVMITNDPNHPKLELKISVTK